MPGADSLNSILIILAAAIVTVPLLQRLKVNPVLAYLAAGMTIGPHGLALIHDIAGAHIVGEFGVIFLLFAIGLDLPLHRLRALGHYIFGLGLAQVAATSLAIGIAAHLLGTTPEAALVIGGALAFSSTAIVIQLLVERGQTAARFGRISVAVLLFQDLAVVPLLALLPLLAGQSTDVVAALGLAAAKAGAAMAIILLLGRFVMRPVYRLVASTRNAELFHATNLFIVLGAGWLSAQAGMSMALGAFLAGLLLAESEYRHQVEADIQPFRGLFLGLFFMTVGMEIDFGAITAQAGPILALALAVIAVKAAILGGLCLAFRVPAAAAARVALLLAQSGEFAFVVFGLAMQAGILPAPLGQMLLIAVAVTMAATPLLAELGRRAAQSLERRIPDIKGLAEETGDLSSHVVIAGYGRVGQTIGKLLAARGIPYVAIDRDARHVAEMRAQGLPVYFGDASRADVLRSAGVERARAAVITLDHPEAAEQAVHQLHQSHPQLKIVVRGHDSGHRQRLENVGAVAVVLEAHEASLQIGAAVLKLAGVQQDEVNLILDSFRRDDYAQLEELAKEPLPKERAAH